MATEVKIKIRAFPYYEAEIDPVTEQERKIERIARRGDIVSLSDIDLDRAKRFGAIAETTDEDVTPEGQKLGAAPPLDGASVEQLSEWLQGNYEDQTSKPSVQDVVDAVDDDDELAKRFLEAENHATGNQPRSTLVEALQKVIDEA